MGTGGKWRERRADDGVREEEIWKEIKRNLGLGRFAFDSLLICGFDFYFSDNNRELGVR